jgi:DNA-binding CsgD family transcriptional regulator
VAAIEAALDDACGAAGAVVVLTAPAGMGKTRLMRAAAKPAAQRQMLVLTCRGDELEREFPFGLVRQLFEPALMELDVQARREVLAGAAALAGELLLGGGQPDAPVGEPALDHALYWLAANLATRAPLALLVDDAHWGDGPSLRALRHLVVRLEGLPVAVVVAARPAEPGAAQDVLDRLAGDPLADHVLPAPLSEGAVAILMQEQLSAADDEFARACHVATGGNPFLLSELLGALRAAGIVPIAENAERVRAIGPNTVARSVLLRLKSLPDEAAVLARTLAILGSGASAAQLARAAGVDERTVARVADALVAADILAPGRPLEFVHPIVRTAVYGSLSTFERSAGHTAAARTLHADGASPETVATHLLHSEPAGEPWTVERLREAAVTAMSVGALGATVAYLERALIEPASARERPEILLALSEGHRHQNSWEQAESVLLQTLQEAGDPATRVDAARRLSTLWLPWRRHAKAPDALAPVISDVRDSCPDLARDLELTLSAAMWLDADEAPVWARRVRQDQVSGGGRDRVERVILSRQAWAATVGGEPAEVAAALARGALQTGELIIEDARAHGFEMSVVTLALAGHTGEAHDHLDRAMTAARRRGHLGRWAFLSAIAAHVLLLEGRLLDAERHALEALDVLRPDGIAFPASLDALVEALLERGQLAAAAQAYGHLADRAALPDTLLLAGLRLTPARMLSAAGDDRAALERALAIGRRQLQLGRPNPAWCAWRSTAALLHLQLGENEAARVLADEELELARAFGAPRAIGVALRVAGLCRGGQSSLRLLREAVAVLESAGAPLEHARALVDLGALLRRSGERGEPARDPLRRGREIAERLDAQPLATRAHEELLAAGARPRRTALRGIDALTPSERRVCELAAQGLSNRQIAQTLFVTVKTVEGHLTAAYGKLGITRKHEIAAAMGAAPVPAAGAARSR